MAGERSRRSARARRSPKDDDSDDPEMSAALQLTRLDGGGSLNDQTKESDRLAKIQEKNRKAQQKYAPPGCCYFLQWSDDGLQSTGCSVRP